MDHIRHMIALGKETYSEGKISYDLVEEMCQVLEDFVKTMNGYKVKGYRAYATSAMREAKNNQIILDQIRVRTGLKVRIISSALSATRPSPPRRRSLTRSFRKARPSWTWALAAPRFPCSTRTPW